MSGKLNLGCGEDYRRGWINVDSNPNLRTDVCCDLNIAPYPFEKNSFKYILMDNVLEHLDDTIKILEELHRISKPNGIIEIIVPHYSGYMALTHLTHKRAFGFGTFNNFEKKSWEKYSNKEFKILSKEIIWSSSRFKILSKILSWIGNRNEYFTERFLTYLFCGFDHIRFKLQVIK